ncbi:MAG: Brp/Blh family beta-carotene 15,15'-dioxygenase [Roseovarius sp.]|nr:Brp/Blh family beta-carotene 15,15'-dioxygenase [Roseovarius sp.]
MAIAYIVIQPELAAQVLMLAPLVAVLGLPHGALDLPIAEALWPLTGWRRKLLFTAAYLGLAGAVIAIWLLAPGAALAMFLGYSALHFSDDWSQAWPALRWSGGATTIGAPALLHHGEVEAIFAVLAPQIVAAVVADVAALVGVLAFAGFVLSCLLSRQARGAAVPEQVILWITAGALPPLMYFVVYFCALHSVRHFTATMRVIADWRRAMAVAVTLSAIVTLAAVMVLLYGSTSQLVDQSEQIIRIVFIGLAALTVPHMILVDRFLRMV